MDGARPGPDNMALDAALLDLAAGEGGCFLRLYRWDPFCLSFGRHEPALRRYDRAAIEARGLSCVRRPTGGRAVWHARELTYALAAPLPRFGGLREAYATIHAMLAAALGTLGARATLAGAAAPPRGIGSGACFAAPVGGEVLVAGRKVVGSAQLRAGDAFLQHGSILLADDQRVVAEVTRGEAPPGGEATLSELLARTVTFEEVAAAIAATAPGHLPGFATAGAAPAAALAGMAVHRPRFASAEWTWLR